MNSCVGIAYLVEVYSRFLKETFPQFHNLFLDRLKADREAAESEAAIFSVLRQLGYNVAIGEKPGEGGVDFHCEGEQGKMVVEVSCVSSSNQSAYPESPDTVTQQGGFFDSMTHVIRRKVCSKVPQLADHSLPRILCLATEHPMGFVHFQGAFVRDIMTSDTTIAIPIGDSTNSVSLVTDLKESIFFRKSRTKPIVEPCRESISAILLAFIDQERTFVTGLLHPAPKVSVPIEMLSGIPFLRIVNWPFKNNQVQTEWTIPNGKPKPFNHLPSRTNNSGESLQSAAISSA